MKVFDTLTAYGIQFQLKTITLLIKELEFLEQSYDIVKSSFYDSEASKWIVEVILKYFKIYKKSPSLDVFSIELKKDITDKIIKRTIVDELKIIHTYQNATDLDYIKENFLQFIKNQEMKTAVLECVDLLSKGEYELIRKRIDTALHAGQERNLGVVWKEEEFFERRIAETLRSPIATPWPVLNEIMGGGIGKDDGGLGKGELGIIVAPGGIGKCVGKDTEIEIEYEEIGIDILDNTIWFKSWDKIFVNDKYMFVYEFANIISNCISRDR